MKKILFVLSTLVVLLNTIFTSQIFAEDIPVYTGKLEDTSYRIVDKNDDVVVVEINGKIYYYKVQK